MCANWRQTAWSMDTTEIDALFQRLQRTSGNAERTINDVLQKKAAPKVMEQIQPTIPLSPRRKKHARKSKALTVKHGNLEFTIRPKRSFTYIKYPDLAIGTSHKNEPKMVMKKGLDSALPDVMSDIVDAVITDIQNTLGGD